MDLLKIMIWSFPITAAFQEELLLIICNLLSRALWLKRAILPWWEKGLDDLMDFFHNHCTLYLIFLWDTVLPAS